MTSRAPYTPAQLDEDQMITANPDTPLGFFCQEVDRMKPGQWMKVSWLDLRDIPAFEHNGAHFSPADRILENIVGSAWTHSYHVDPMSGDVVFVRHEQTDERRYTSPDRR